MFARWRNLVAAAGAIWFPFMCAQASPDRDDSRYNLPPACARYYDPAEMNPWRQYDRESWYQQYYSRSWNDPRSSSDEVCDSENLSSYESNLKVGSDDNSSDQFDRQFHEPENPTSGDPGAVLESRIEETIPEIDGDGRCSDLTCPCHDTIDLDYDDQPREQDASSFDETFCPRDQYNFVRECFDEYAPYSFEDKPSDEPTPTPTRAALVPQLINLDDELSEDMDQLNGEEDSRVGVSFESAPKVQLSGTIEPIIEEDEEATEGSFDEFDEFLESTFEPNTTMNEDEAISTGENSEGEAEEPQDAAEDLENDSADQRSRLHMFYPGCDWSPYYPVEGEQGTSAQVD